MATGRQFESTACQKNRGFSDIGVGPKSEGELALYD
jgi:hypothetical protein